ncbi:MAG TPA: gamma-glutamyltransferase [Pirellulales bacterium]|nr:gamma-glutamyltransferase [Pirellulales bacterium]
MTGISDRRRKHVGWLVIWLMCAAPAARAATSDVTVSTKGLVVSVSAEASRAGAAVLGRGGNAVDAAIATAFALAVTYPAAGNIGGGGYMVVWPGDNREPAVFDFREQAPAAAKADMLARSEDRTAHRLVGVPGTVRGLALAHQRFGSHTWRQLVEPAVPLARDGFELDADNAESLSKLVRRAKAPHQQELRRVFSPPQTDAWHTGDRLRQPELARTLEIIAERGPDGFYAGAVAELLVAEMQRGAGLITAADLAAYRAIERQPLHGRYRGFDVYGVPPSSSGGTTLIEALNILENFDLAKQGRWSASTLHVTAEAMKRAYRDRARYLGDPAFNTIPAKLLDKEYARQLAQSIDPQRATPSASLAGDILLRREGEHTTHLSVVDGRGMAVSMTYTLESSYGSQVVVRGAGFLLNDEMRDFNRYPGIIDTTGNIGTAANLAAPGKRMLSSMCPTILCRDGKPVLVTGSPGGRTIINTVLCIVMNVVDFQMDVRSAVDAPRMHHAWFPDSLQVEPELAQRYSEALDALKAMGQAVGPIHSQGDAHSIAIDPKTGQQTGAADHRISGHAAAPE